MPGQAIGGSTVCMYLEVAVTLHRTFVDHSALRRNVRYKGRLLHPSMTTCTCHMHVYMHMHAYMHMSMSIYMCTCMCMGGTVYITCQLAALLHN